MQKVQIPIFIGSVFFLTSCVQSVEDKCLVSPSSCPAVSVTTTQTVSGSGSPSPTPTPAILLTDGQAASGGVVGQADLVSNAGGGILVGPIGDVVIYGSTLYVPDQAHGQIPSFAMPVSPGDSPSFTNTHVFGLVHSLVVTAANALIALTTANDESLFIWNTPPTTNALIDLQVDSDQGGGNTSFNIEDIATSGTKLVTANGSTNTAFIHDNVSIFNTIPTTGNQSPDLSLTHSSSGSLASPKGVWTNGTKLIVSDTGNNRVLIWNAFPTADVSPDLVLDTTSGVAMSGPTNVYSLSGMLFVCDTGNNRVLVWNTIPVASHTSPDHVLGQSDFSGTTANRGGSVAANTLSAPRGIYINGSHIYVTDTGNNRILIF